jgi:hypothetical protein
MSNNKISIHDTLDVSTVAKQHIPHACGEQMSL